MWTTKNRPRYDRDKLRYPSDLTDEEWSLIEPLIPPAKRGGRKRVEPARIRLGMEQSSEHRCTFREVACAAPRRDSRSRRVDNQTPG